MSCDIYCTYQFLKNQFNLNVTGGDTNQTRRECLQFLERTNLGYINNYCKPQLTRQEQNKMSRYLDRHFTKENK